ncbi:MAG: hypothetical protein ACW96X_12005 [Promethearchaeota archaeon]|jgi:hypothetical protein
MKLAPSKKDIIPSLTSALFFAWMILWLVSILIGWVPLDLYRIFYLFLPLPWIILIIIVWVNWKNINDKILYPKYGKTHFDPLYIKGGLVRLFQIVLIFIVFLYYIVLEINAVIILIPSGLLVVVNAILAYFGFKPSDVLPKDYVIESLNVDVPNNKKLLSSLPVIKDALNQFEVKFKETVDTIDQLVKQTNASANDIITNIEGRLEDIEKIGNNIPYHTFSRDEFEKYNYLILVILLAVINIIVQPAFNVPSYVALPTFSIFGILIGVSARNKVNGNISNKLSEDIQALKKELNSFKDDLQGISNFTSDKLDDLRQLYDAFMQSNFLEFLPANYSPLLSIGFVSFLSLFVFILPLPIPEAIFTTMQWFVIYYFTTKQ